MFAVNFQKRAQDSTGSNSSAAGPSPLSSYHSCPSVDSARSQEVKFRSIQSSFDSIKEIPKKRQSLSNKSGLVFPASKTLKKLKKGKFADTIREGAAVYMAGVLEYLTAEILECSGSYTREMKRKRISPRHINLAIRADKELDDFLKDVTIADGGVFPYFPDELLPKKTAKNSNKNSHATGSSEKTADQDVVQPNMSAITQ